MKKAEPWKILIVLNLFLTLMLFWYTYSQISMLTRIIEDKLPVTFPDFTSSTSLVIPFTGQFLIVQNSVLVCSILITILLAFIFWFLKKKSIF